MNKDKLLIEKPINKTYRIIRILRNKQRKPQRKANKKPQPKANKKTKFKQPPYRLRQANKSLSNTMVNLRWFELEQYSFNWSTAKKVRYILDVNQKGLTYESIESIILSIEPNIKGDNLTNNILIEINSSNYCCYVNNDGLNQYVLKPKIRIKLSRKKYNILTMLN